MKGHLIILAILFFLAPAAWSQNRITYSQYMHNQGVFNPGYFSAGEQFTATGYYRKQWLGIPGAPTTKSLVAGLDFKKRHRFNLNIYQDGITIFSDTKLGLGYNYRIKLNETDFIALGVKGDYGKFQSDFSSLDAQDITDVVMGSSVAQSYFNVGAGLYYQTPSFYLGISSPFILNNSALKPYYNLGSTLFKFNHLYITMGGKFFFEKISFFPTTLIKTVGGSPIQVDLNANFLLYNQIWLSGGIRTDRSLILSTGYVMKKGIKVIYSYDIASFSNANYSAGSHEFSVGYGFSFYRTGFSRKKYMKNRGGKFKRRFKTKPRF